MAEGLSNAEIGEQLFITETTVKTHIGHVLTAMQGGTDVAGTQTALAAAATDALGASQ